jgi:hypothetical protein
VRSNPDLVQGGTCLRKKLFLKSISRDQQPIEIQTCELQT